MIIESLFSVTCVEEKSEAINQRQSHLEVMALHRPPNHQPARVMLLCGPLPCEPDYTGLPIDSMSITHQTVFESHLKPFFEPLVRGFTVHPNSKIAL